MAKKSNIDPQIMQIVGKQAAARLSKSRINTLDQIRITKPETLMSIAGIGPNKAKELYRLVGIDFKIGFLNKLYNALKRRTKLVGVLATEDKRLSAVSKLESLKRGVVDFNNLAISVHNFGLPADQKLSTITPTPVSLTTSGTSFSVQQSARNFYGEYSLSREDSNFKVNYLLLDMENNNEINKFNISFSFIQEIISDIKSKYNQIKKLDADSIFYILLDKNVRNVLNLKDEEKFIKIYLPELPEDPNIRVIRTEDYVSNGWVKEKYIENQDVLDMFRRFEGFRSLEEYEEYKKQGGLKTFEEYEGESKSFDEIDWFRTTSLFLQSDQLPLKFGFLKGIPQIRNFENNFEQKEVTLPLLDIPSNYEDYLELKRKPAVLILDKNVSQLAVAWAKYTIGEFSIYFLNSLSPIILRSSKYPNFGAVIG